MGVIVIATHEAHHRRIENAAGVAWVLLHRALEVMEGLLVVTSEPVKDAELAIEESVLRVQLDGRFQLLHRAFRLVRLEEGRGRVHLESPVALCRAIRPSHKNA